MSNLVKPLMDTFTDSSKGVFGEQLRFTDDHKIQIDALQAIVDEINASGILTAKIESFLKQDAHPVLKITHNSDNKGQTFFIGFDILNGPPKLKLSTGMERTPLKKDTSYDLSDENDRKAMLEAIGHSVAMKRNSLIMGESITAYAAPKK